MTCQQAMLMPHAFPLSSKISSHPAIPPEKSGEGRLVAEKDRKALTWPVL